MEASAEQEFEVERLLDRRLVRGQEQFLVRWRGYSQFDDTWEPVENLANAQDELARFRAELAAGQQLE